MRYSWILKNRSEEYRVKRLIKLIEDSGHFKDIDHFSECIAFAFNELSKIIHTQTLIPGSGNMIFNYTTRDQPANEAMKIFMSLYEIKDVVVTYKKQ